MAEETNDEQTTEEDSINGWLRGLIVIEALSAQADFSAHQGFQYDDDGELIGDRSVSELSRQQLENDFLSLKKAMSEIFRYSHVLTNNCGNPHESWVDDFLNTEKTLISHKEIPPPQDQPKTILPPKFELPDPNLFPNRKSSEPQFEDESGL